MQLTECQKKNITHNKQILRQHAQWMAKDEMQLPNLS
jgi:hypothetical protein